MRFKLTLTISHPNFGEESHLVHDDILNAPSRSQLFKKLSLPGKILCQLKNYGKCEWFDKNDTFHCLELTEEHH